MEGAAAVACCIAAKRMILKVSSFTYIWNYKTSMVNAMYQKGGIGE